MQTFYDAIPFQKSFSNKPLIKNVNLEVGLQVKNELTKLRLKKLTNEGFVSLYALYTKQYALILCGT